MSPSFVLQHSSDSCQSQVLTLSLHNSLDPFFHIPEFVSDASSSSGSVSHGMHNAAASDFFPVALLLWIVFQHPVVCSQLFD